MDGGKVVKKEGKMDGGFRACVDGLFAPDADNKQRFPSEKHLIGRRACQSWWRRNRRQK